MLKKQRIHVKEEIYTGEVKGGVPVKGIKTFTFKGLVATQNLNNPQLSLPLISEEVLKIHLPKDIHVSTGSEVRIENNEAIYRVVVSSTKKPSPLAFNSFILCEGVNDE